jgi:uncharacterized protein
VLSALLNDALAIKGVTSAAVVSSDGLILEGASHDERNLGHVGGLITSALASSRALSGLLGDGELQQAMIEYENGPVLILPLSVREDAPVMVATLQSSAVLGRARLQLRRLVPEVAKAAGA